MIESKPFFSGFDPRAIPSQAEAFRFLRDFDYSKGTPELLLSGSVGSSKSIFMAFWTVLHCMTNVGARVCLGRRSMPDLKKTILAEILEMMAEDFVEGVDYTYNKSASTIDFLKTRSQILSISWSDKKYNKARSLKLSGVVIEELTENDENDKKAFMTLKARLRRIPTVKQNFLLAATNPEGPGHWAYRYFIEPKDHATRKVVYSRTEQNPFLDPVYIQQLKADMDPREARRMLFGEWIEIDAERIYHAYSDANYLHDKDYELNKQLPILLNFDFNIAAGKPMSCALMQYDKPKDTFHIFKECVVHGSRTLDIMEELESQGVFDLECPQFVIHGDAAGKARDTRNIFSDYEIITKFLANKNLRWKLEVPQSNPAIRNRHNRVNAYCKNELGQHRLFVYKGCKTVDEGFRLTQLKKGGDYIEDDSKHFQHITTAIGYGVFYEANNSGLKQISSQRMR